MKLSILLFLLLLEPFAPQLRAQEKIVVDPNLKNKNNFPVPKEDNQLFYLQRDPNTNTVIYTLNINNGEIDEHSPVKAHWIRYAEDGQRSDLSFIQRRMAYGVHHKKINENEYDIRIQAYKDLPIRVRYNESTNKYQAYTKIDDKEILLKRIFVRISGGSLFNPDVEYIEVSGIDPKSKSKRSHRFLPD